MGLSNLLTFLKENEFSSKEAEELGIHMNISKSIIDKICSDNNGDSDKKLAGIINYWQRNKDVSWINLSKALEKCGYKNLATFIRKNAPCEGEVLSKSLFIITMYIWCDNVYL